MNRKNDQIRQVIGLISIALIFAWYHFWTPPEQEAVQVKVKGSTYTAAPDSTLEIPLADSSSLRIKYEQTYGQTKDTKRDTASRTSPK